MSNLEPRSNIEQFKRCPQCHGSYRGEGVILKSQRGATEYCSSDCLLDAYETQRDRDERKRGGEPRG